MKRTIIAFLLSVLTLLTLCACGDTGGSFGVPDGQIDADEDIIAGSVTKYKRDLIAGLMKKNSYTLLGREVTHAYDEQSHIDSAVVHYTFDSWLGKVEVIRPCSYQFAKDSDLWELIDLGDAEPISAKLSNGLKGLEGRSFDAECRGWGVNGCIHENAVTIESVDTSSYPLTVTVSYDIDTRSDKYNLGHWLGQTTVTLELKRSTGGEDLLELCGAVHCTGSTESEAFLSFSIEDLDTCVFKVFQ